MNKSILSVGVAFTATLIFMAVTGNSPVFAQPDQAQTRTELARITVVAPRVTRQRGPAGERHWEIVTVDQSAFVDISDLDLQRSADLLEAEGRVETAAIRICEELETQYPDGRPSTNVCIRRAVEDAMTEVREATFLAAR